MSERAGIPITFVPRDEILEPAAAIGVGAAARALAERLLLHDDERLRQWTGVAGAGVLAVLGPSDSLPWVDGVCYLGREARAPRLLLPTNLQPSPIAFEVFERALLARFPSLRTPLAVIAEPPRIFSLVEALPIERERIRKWLEANP